MAISTGFIENHGFEKVNNSTWRNGAYTLQSKYYSTGSNIFDRAISLKKAFRGCFAGKFRMIVETEDDFHIFML